jgi:secreted trypsin-like serine protease
MVGYNCGASIITTNHVITAAHCTDPSSIPPTWRMVKVRVGELDLETGSDCEEISSVYYCGFPAIDIEIERTFIHEQYSSYQSGSPNDIAIIKLKQAIEFNEFVKPICLPLANEINISYGSLTVAGFGKTEESELSSRLMKAEVDIVDNRSCATKYLSQSRTIHSSQICAARTGMDAWYVPTFCMSNSQNRSFEFFSRSNGDSGGGLYKQPDNSQTWFLAGIVSFGPRRCASSLPGVYVNIKSYLEWIESKIEERN